MAQKLKVNNGPGLLILQQITIGSQMTPLALHIVQETSPGSGIMEDMDLTDMTVACHVKDNLKRDVEPDMTVTVTMRQPLTGGWVDLNMDGTETAKGGERLYYGSVKVWPTANPELGVTVLRIEMPFVYEATR